LTTGKAGKLECSKAGKPRDREVRKLENLDIYLIEFEVFFVMLAKAGIQSTQY
jgi:hypothetical protein